MTWRSQAKCLGATRLFYEDVFPDVESLEHDEDGLATARAICAACPVRKECMVDVMLEEVKHPEDERHGVAAFMTPRQRISLERRGTARCKCGHLRDPIDLVAGLLHCPRCGTHTKVPPIPDTGDRWAKRHTTLARKIMAWLADNAEPGDAVPSPTKMAPVLGATLHDVMHVYHGLHAEGTLAREGTRYYRTARKGASWYETYPN